MPELRDSIGRLAICCTPTEWATQALIEEIGGYHSALWEVRQPNLEEARELLVPEQVAAAAAPDFGGGHDVGGAAPGPGRIRRLERRPGPAPERLRVDGGPRPAFPDW